MRGPHQFERSELGAVAASFLLGGFAIASHWRGTDYPAQLFRVDLFRTSGLTLWNNQWYSGHATPGYGILAPALGAVIGPLAVGLAACVVASGSFAVLARRHWGPEATAGALLFAVGTVVNLAIGRLPFALGLAFGLQALVHLAGPSTPRRAFGLAFAIDCSLASPVAGTFLAIVATSCAVGNARTGHGLRLFVATCDRWAATMAVFAVAPIAIAAALFPEGGPFPFAWTEATFTLATCVVVGWLTPDRTVRIASALYAAVTAIVFVTPNPLGGNVVRLGMFVGAPILTCMLWRRRRSMLILSVALLLVWQWRPATSAIFPDRTDPSTTAMFYQPLLDRLGPTAGRIEIPFTRAHWETVFVADRVALARGWERQLDHKYDQLLYEPTLSASDYRAWLVDNAVQYVALPNVPLDFSSQREADLLRSGVAGLQQIWHSRYWTVWAVTGTRHLVEGPAHLTHMDTNTFELAATGVGAITIRTHYSPRWTVTGPGCVRSTPAGWTQIVASAPGRLALRQRLTLKSTPCPDVPADAT